MTSVEVSQQVDAPGSRIWELISDPTKLAALTAECNAMTWVRPSNNPLVGARFRGSNRSGWRRWSTTCTITRYVPEVEIAWDVAFGPLNVAEWSYVIQQDEAATSSIVTERFVDHRAAVLRASSSLVRGVSDTEAHNRANMAQTLSRIKARAEF
jgi:uncharacterized protein YndB with AHSA1/START domain